MDVSLSLGPMVDFLQAGKGDVENKDTLSWWEIQDKYNEYF